MWGSLTRPHGLFCFRGRMWGCRQKHTTDFEQFFSCSFVMLLLWFALSFPFWFLQYVCFPLSQMAACLSLFLICMQPLIFMSRSKQELAILLKVFSTQILSQLHKQQTYHQIEMKSKKQAWTELHADWIEHHGLLTVSLSLSLSLNSLHVLEMTWSHGDKLCTESHRIFVPIIENVIQMRRFLASCVWLLSPDGG